jgi:hypothetical protein
MKRTKQSTFAKREAAELETGFSPTMLIQQKQEGGDWYEAQTGTHQGLVVEEGTGKTIAVTYGKADTPLIVAAPKMLRALKHAAEVYGNITLKTGATIATLGAYQLILATISEAEGRA